MTMRYVHTSLVARDWRALAAFYAEVLGCRLVPPVRGLEGAWLARGTGVPAANPPFSSGSAAACVLSAAGASRWMARRPLRSPARVATPGTWGLR